MLVPDGRIAVFLNGSPLFTGTAGSGEGEIRRYLLQRDLVDAIVAMPNDFFFSTGIAAYIWVLDNAKEERRPQLDERGEIVRDKEGRPIIDKEKNDTENVSLIESVEAYMEREVLPYAPDAWIETRKQKNGQMLELRDGGVVGYELPFMRFFYECTPLRPSADILVEIRELEAGIAERMQGDLGIGVERGVPACRKGQAGFVSRCVCALSDYSS